MSHLKYGLLSFILIASLPLYAATILHVSSSTDNDAGGYGESGDLRYAINTMNEQLNLGNLDNYQIVFDMPMTISLNGILPIINNSTADVNITIGNAGTTQTVILDGQNQFNGFFTPMGNITIQNMIFQNLLAKGGDGGDGISGGGGGMGAGPALYIPQTFLNGSYPQITLKNVLIKECSAIGGNGGHYNISSSTGDEGGGGGGGFAGHGGSIKTNGSTGGGGGGGFGGHGGDVTLSSNTDPLGGGGGGGGGGIGSLSTILSSLNLGRGGDDNTLGTDGNGYGLNFIGGTGAGGFSGGIRAGGGGGGGSAISIPDQSGGGGGGSYGANGLIPIGTTPRTILRSDITPSGGNGSDGGGGGGGGVVNLLSTSNSIDGQAGNGGYGGGGGGGAGTGAYDYTYTVQGGGGGIGGGGGGGGVNASGSTSAQGGDSQAGGGGGPSNGIVAAGGTDTGGLGGGAGGSGNDNFGLNYGGGGGGGGSAHGGAIFVDSALNLIIEAFSDSETPTSFDTQNNTVLGGDGGVGDNSQNGQSGSATGDSIFLRSASALTLKANAVSDTLTLGSGVNFMSDSSNTTIFINGRGTVIYNGISDRYEGNVKIDQANFEVNGTIASNNLLICRSEPSSTQRGTLSGRGLIDAYVLANSGSISPDANQTLTLKNLTLNSASSDSLGSLVHSEINANGASLVRVNQTANLAGILEINVDANAVPGHYILLSANSIIGQFENIQFVGNTPNYTLSYLPQESPQYIQFELLSDPTSVDIPATVNGHSIVNPAVVCCGRPVLLGPLPIAGSGPTVYTIQSQTGHVKCQIRTSGSQTFLKMYGTNGSCTIVGTKNGIQSNPLTIVAPTT